MNSWRRLACYPRSTFYPLSDGDSAFHRRTTKPDFRLCSTCRSHSQPALCLYTLLMIAFHDEASFGLLRYFLGGYRPSQTAHLSLSGDQIHDLPLEKHMNATGISPTAPRHLTTSLHSLPAILHTRIHNPITDYSKGSRGLFVPSRENRIFTAITISPRSSLRQYPDRYTIRAGRNSPDKEFRYLRTVIFTAAIHSGLGLELRRVANPEL